METADHQSKSEYWFRWQVLVCALSFILPTTIAVILFGKKGGGRGCSLNHADFWITCWTNINPRWLLVYRAFSFAASAFLLYQTVVVSGFFDFLFYTQWTFTLVMIYFALSVAVSARGCLIDSKTRGGKEKCVEMNSEDSMLDKTLNSKEKHFDGFTNLQVHELQVGSLEYLMHALYQACAGAVVLTDIVFWCLLFPFMAGENFHLTPLISCMHSVNAFLLLLETSLNRLPFHWIGIIYFVMWSGAYVVFQWILHACCISWWPYPFLELASPSAPLWYLALALVHIPCYGLYFMIVKAKHSVFSTMFSNIFIRSNLS